MRAVVKYDNRDGATKIIDVDIPEITEHVSIPVQNTPAVRFVETAIPAKRKP